MIWIIGCNGMLGSEVVRLLKEKNCAYIGTDRELDFTDMDALKEFSNGKDIRWIINCAAFTAVDSAEDNIDAAESLNAFGPQNLIELCNEIGAKIIHISTDYVFDGRASVPYTEDMETCPESVYGRTKGHGEDLILNNMKENAWILRTSWLYGWNGKNFVYTMIKAFNNNESRIVVNDQRGTPTLAFDLASTILTLIEQVENKNDVPCGIYHFSNLGNITWYDFACKINELGKKYAYITNDCKVMPCSTDMFPVKANRPAYSVLSKEKIQKTLNIKIPEWQESLEKFISSSLFQKERIL